MNDVLFAFIIFQATFIFLDIYILSKVTRDIVRKGEYTFFSALIIFHIIYLVMNSTWSLQEYGIIHLNHVCMTLLCIFSYLSVTCCSYTFCMFTVEKISGVMVRKKIIRFLFFIPGLLTFILVLSSPLNGWVFSLKKDNTLIQGPAYIVMLISSAFYLVVVMIIALRRYIFAKLSVQKRSAASLLMAVAIIILFVIIDNVFPKVSIIPVAVFAAITVIFINMQQSNINSDVLTGLSNRRKAYEYLTSQIAEVSEGKQLYIFMCDLNGFKEINDTYGHPEGDDALLVCSNVLKDTFIEYEGFVSRFGGDEFLASVLLHQSGAINVDALIHEVNSKLSKKISENKKPYCLSISIGYCICTDKNESLSDCIKKADKMLYDEKKRHHGTGNYS